MFTRTVIVAVVAASSLVLAGAQAIGGEEFQPEASLIGLGQQLAGRVMPNVASRSAVAARLSARR